MSLVTRAITGFLFVSGLLFFLPGLAQAAVHTVARGESLYTISRSYGVPLDSLIQANGIRGSEIYPGQQLHIPGRGQGQAVPYTVRQGDSLFLIAQRFGSDIDSIRRNNNISGSTIYPGMLLYIPAATRSASQLPTFTSRGGVDRRITPAEFDLLCRLVHAEAEGEPYEGKVAVAAVVLNRVRSHLFPDTIREVIYESEGRTYQFEPVLNGWIHRPAGSDSVRATLDALNGWDPSRGSIFFFATYVTNKWLWARPMSRIIGNHVFTY